MRWIIPEPLILRQEDRRLGERDCSYIGKTDRTLLERVKEHAYKDKESAVYKHLDSCFDKLFLTHG